MLGGALRANAHNTQFIFYHVLLGVTTHSAILGCNCKAAFYRGLSQWQQCISQMSLHVYVKYGFLPYYSSKELREARMALLPISSVLSVATAHIAHYLACFSTAPSMQSSKRAEAKMESHGQSQVKPIARPTAATDQCTFSCSVDISCSSRAPAPLQAAQQTVVWWCCIFMGFKVCCLPVQPSKAQEPC